MFVIIGNSIAGISAAEKIREHDKDTLITIVSDEPHHVYSRPMIPGLIYDKWDLNDMLFKEKDFYKKNNIITKLGKKVTKINEKENEIVLENEEKIAFNKLLIATGGSAFIPPIKGHDNDVLTLINFNDAEKIKENTKTKNKFIVIGAGLIGLKAAEGLIKAGKEVEVVELADRVLSAIADKEASEIFLKELNKNKVKVHLNTSVEEILRNENNIIGVKLSNAKQIECNSIIIAIGVRPNIELTKDTEIKINKGIITNNNMQTSNPNIFAAGDCIESYDIITKEKRNIALWPNASLQGKIAGANMANKNETYPGSYMMNSISFFDLPIISYGLVSAEGSEYEILTNKEKNNYKKVILKNNKIVGAVFVNDIDRAGIINGIIREDIDISRFKEHLVKSSLSFVYLPKKMRVEKLTTVPKVKL